MPTTKLYLPYGTFGEAGDQKYGWYNPRTAIILQWFCVGRETPIAPYESLIMGYRTLNETVRTRAQQTVDEFLSESEFHQLRDYLRQQHGKDLRTAVLTAPVAAIRPDTTTRTGALRPFRFCLDAAPSAETREATEGAEADESPVPEPIMGRIDPPLTRGGFCRLAEESGYSLPFAVWGYFTAMERP